MSYSETKPSPTMRYFEQEDILHLAIANSLFWQVKNYKLLLLLMEKVGF